MLAGCGSRAAAAAATSAASSRPVASALLLRRRGRPAAPAPGRGMAAAAAGLAQPPLDDPIVQWVVLRRDLWTDLGWPLGPVIAQACHASSAAICLHLDDPDTRQYVSDGNLDHMHKVVLEVKSEQQLANLSTKLEQEGIRHKLWVEQPEDYPTCLATKPYRRSQAAALFKKLQLCKAVLGGGAVAKQQQQQQQS